MSPPDLELQVGSGTHAEQTSRALVELERAISVGRPELVVVPGDVNSTLAGALAAVKLGVPVCHVEAGLRSFDRSMPEEHNRRVADHLSSLLLTHSEAADENLAREGIADGVVMVGNTMIDTLLANLAQARATEPWRALGLDESSYLLVTLHRPALVDDPALLLRAIGALHEVARELPVVFPVHPRTRARLQEHSIPTEGLHVVGALPYHTFIGLEACARAVVTDSGGVQEETTVLGVRCFTLRANTERPVTVDYGTNEVLGLEPERILEIPERLAVPREHRIPPLWDGHAGERAADAIVSFINGGR